MAGDAELAGWRVWCEVQAGVLPAVDFDQDLAPAFRYGLDARRDWRDPYWNSELEGEMAQEWELRRCRSRLSWTEARELARKGFEGFRGAPRRRPGRPPVALTPTHCAPRSTWRRWWQLLSGTPV